MGVGIQSYKEHSIGNKPKNQLFSQMHFYGPSANLIQLSSSIMTKVYIASVFGQDQGYMVKKTFAWRSSRGRSPMELLKAKGYIWPNIPSRVLIQHFIILTITRKMFTSLISWCTVKYTPCSKEILKSLNSVFHCWEWYSHFWPYPKSWIAS